jgi:ATP-dependent helicase/nuclease subunit B
MDAKNLLLSSATDLNCSTNTALLDSEKTHLSFLDQVVDSVMKQPDPASCLVILPSQRATGKFHRRLAAKMPGAGWLPKACTLGTVLQEHAGLTPMDPLEGLAELYLTWTELKALDQSSDIESIGFTAFGQWGRIALRDFNEIDQYLLDPKAVFKNLCDIEGIEEWSFQSEADLKSGQRQFLRRFMQLGPLYEAFQKKLADKQWGYGGRIARVASESKSLEAYSHVFVAGLSVLTPAERAFLHRYEQKNSLTWLWDADASYVTQPMMEAGLFIRNQALPQAINALPRRLEANPPSIHIIGCSSSVYQAQAVREIVSNIPVDQRDGRTAVVLPDGASLPLVLQSLPELNNKGYNVTMGLSWGETPASGFLEAVKPLVLRSGQQLNHGDLRSIISDPVALAACGRTKLIQDGSRVMNQLAKKHLAWLNASQLGEHSNGILVDFVNELLTNKAADPLEASIGLERWAGSIGNMLTLNDAKSELDPWIMASWERVMQAFSVVRRFQEQHGLLSSCEEVWSMALQSLAAERIDLLGEPEDGLQIMGLIETRALDFDRVIVLDCNEGVLPKSAISDSFLPFDLRGIWGLPGRHEREAIFAYYTYRLLNQAREVFFLYRAQDEASEKSRYLLQLEQAFRPNGEDLLPVDVSTLQAPLPGPRPAIPALQWTPQASTRLAAWAQKGISPSALNTLINCKRNFFYQYLLRLSEPSEVQEEMASSTFGSVVHQVLEDGLKLFLDKPLQQEHLSSLKKDVQRLLPIAIKKHFNSDMVRQGENYLQVTMAEATLKKILTSEMTELHPDSQRVIRHLELNLSHTFTTGGRIDPIRLNGMADRIERDGDEVIITDYKTGNVTSSELSLPADWDEKVTSGKASKALQLLVYAAMALETLDVNGNKKEPDGQPLLYVRAGVRSGKNARAGLLELKIDKQSGVDTRQAKELLRWISQSLDTLHDDTPSVEHKAEAAFCSYCTVLDPLPQFSF